MGLQAVAAIAANEDKGADTRRVVTRITTHWFLEALGHVRAFGDGDILDGLIMLAITDANTSHLNGHGERYRGTGDVPPDNVRRPVSVYVIARELGLSYETARRHVQRLIKAGKIERVEEGVFIPERVFSSPEVKLLTSRTFGTTRKLLDQLRDSGLV